MSPLSLHKYLSLLIAKIWQYIGRILGSYLCPPCPWTESFSDRCQASREVLNVTQRSLTASLVQPPLAFPSTPRLRANYIRPTMQSCYIHCSHNSLRCTDKCLAAMHVYVSFLFVPGFAASHAYRSTTRLLQCETAFAPYIPTYIQKQCMLPCP